MRRFLSVALPVAAVIVLADVVFAQGPGGWGGSPMAGGMSGGMMGPGMMGGRTGPGGQAGQGACPGMTTGGQQAPATPSTEEKAKGSAQ